MKDLLNKIENYMQKLPKNQLMMLYVVVILVASSLLYNFVPDLMYKNELLKDEISILKKNIQRSSTVKLKKVLQRNKKLLLQKKREYRETKEQAMYILSKLYSLKFAFFDEKEWINTLYKILNRSVTYNIEIKYVKNNNIDKTAKDFSLVKIKRSITIEAVGDFKNLVRYINYIESLPALLKFEVIDFGLEKNNVKVLLQFDAYGIGI